MSVPETPVRTLRDRLQRGEDICLLDVREPFEVEVAQVEGALAIPMGQIPGRLDEIPRDRTVAVMCHHGIRSRQVASWLHAQGYSKIENVAGGIDAWSLDVDPQVPRYG